MEIQGELIVIGQTETIGAKGFKKRLVVIKTDEQYPQTIPVEFTQDKTGMIDLFEVGEFVKIGINIRGTEWQGRYFANINGWNINKGEKEKSAESFMPDRQATKVELQDDGLPF